MQCNDKYIQTILYCESAGMASSKCKEMGGRGCMGKNFILKDEKGRPGGYLTQGLGKIRCGIKSGAGGEITLVYAHGGEVTHALGQRAQAEWTDDGRELLAAYAQCGGEMLFTCERGKRAWERRRNRQLIEDMRMERQQREAAYAEVKDGGQSPGNDGNETDKIEDTPVQDAADEQIAPETQDAPGAVDKNDAREDAQWPEPRWPAPPCMPRARYVSGRWED